MVPLLEISQRLYKWSGSWPQWYWGARFRWAFLKGTAAMHGWQVAWMWLGGSVSHLMAEALWAIMHINEIGCYHIPTVWLGYDESWIRFVLPQNVPSSYHKHTINLRFTISKIGKHHIPLTRYDKWTQLYLIVMQPTHSEMKPLQFFWNVQSWHYWQFCIA